MKKGKTVVALSLAMILTAMPVMSASAETVSYEDGDTISETEMEAGSTSREYTININKTLTTSEADVFDVGKIAAAVTNGSAQAAYNTSGSSIGVPGSTVSGIADVTVTYPAASGTGSLVIYSDCGSVVNTPESVSVTTTNDAAAALTYDFNSQYGDGEGNNGNYNTITLKYYYSEEERKYYWGTGSNLSDAVDPASLGVTNIQHAVGGDQLTITTYCNGIYRHVRTEDNGAIATPVTMNWPVAQAALNTTTTFKYNKTSQTWSIDGGDGATVTLSDYGIGPLGYKSGYTEPNDGETITYNVGDKGVHYGTVTPTLASRGEAISYDDSNAKWDDSVEGNTLVLTYGSYEWSGSDGEDYMTSELKSKFGIKDVKNEKRGDQITITRVPATYSVSAGNGKYDSACDVLLATINMQYQLKQNPAQPENPSSSDDSQSGTSGEESSDTTEKTYNSIENTGNGGSGSAYNGPYKADATESKGNLGNHTASSAPTLSTTSDTGEQVSGWNAIASDIDSKIKSKQLGKSYTIEMNGSTRLDSSVAVKLGQNKVSSLNLQLENSTSVTIDPRIFVTKGGQATVKTADGKTANLYLDVTANTTQDVRSGKIDTQFIPYSVIVSKGGDITSRMVAVRTNSDRVGRLITISLTKTKQNATKVTLYSYDGTTGKLIKVRTVKYGKNGMAKFPVSLANYNFVAIEE